MGTPHRSSKKPISVAALHAGAIKAFRIAVEKALARHEAAGVPAAIWRDGKVVYLSVRQLRALRLQRFRSAQKAVNRRHKKTLKALAEADVVSADLRREVGTLLRDDQKLLRRLAKGM